MYTFQYEAIDRKTICKNISYLKEENEPIIIHEDSMTAWINNATDKYALTVKDISKLKFGDKLDVVFFDRNIGDYSFGKPAGEKYNPIRGLTPATYIHADGLMDLIKFVDINIVQEFEWEINLAAVRIKMFWGPADVEIKDLNPKILVGWRGDRLNYLMQKNICH